jgi:hypothetical protein
MNETCGCCDGIQQLTPIAIANRPGLDALLYRVGTHGSFLETMLARLSSLWICLSDLNNTQPCQEHDKIYPLRGLSTRSPDDPAIAFVDAWATVADVLTFYQERIANEGYLRTATERRSILELARLVGYILRPGVAASVYLAYTLEKDHDVVILPGNRAQSIPGPGELPQSFETAEKLEARFAWNALKPRLTRPQLIIQNTDRTGLLTTTADDNGDGAIYLQGTSTKLKPGEPLLFIFDEGEKGQTFRHVKTIEAQTAANRTKVLLQEKPEPVTAVSHQQAVRSLATRKPEVSLFRRLVDPLSRPPSLQPRNSQRLERSVPQAFSVQSDIHPQMLVNFTPLLQSTFYSALANVQDTPPQPLESIQALRVKAALFGHNLPTDKDNYYDIDIPLDPDATFQLWLDAEYKEIVKDGWAVLEVNGKGPIICKVVDVQAITKKGKDVTTTTNTGPTDPNDKTTPKTTSTTTTPGSKMRVTQLNLQLISPQTVDSNQNNLTAKDTTIYVQSEELQPADKPVDTAIGLGTEENDHIELDALYDGLKSGQRLIISGERTDILQIDPKSPGGISSVPGIRTSELVMLAAVKQDVQQIPVETGADPDKKIVEVALPGDKKHTFLQFAKPLAYTYKRNSVTIYANVVRATHGETRTEVLGSGDGSKALQEFALRQSPLTYLAAPTPAGAESTLQVRVNDILWHEAESLAGLKPADRSYVLETGDAGKTTVIFGNGQSGARLPTGVENVKAVYRTGIGRPGNVRAEQISLLSTKPLGVKSVINPLRASGGADKESRDQARRNVPLALLALDRLVSVQDYQDFARTYAGIGKASARRLSDRSRQLVHLTIAGADNIPIDTTSDLYLNLLQALRQFGDPNEPLRIDLAEVLFLVISAKVRLLPDYQLESVEPKIRGKLLDTFSFDRRQLGQPVFQSEVLSVIQSIAGVDYLDLEVMGAVGQEKVLQAFDTFQPQNPGPNEKEEDENQEEEKGETPEQEEAEEFLELLGLTGATDVIVRLAQINPHPIDPFDPKKPPKSFLPAQLAFLSSDVPDTLIITEFPR